MSSIVNQVAKLQQQGQFNTAITLCQQSQATEFDAAIEAKLGTLYCQIEDFKSAQYSLDKVLASNGKPDASIMTDIAGIYLLLGIPSLALQQLDNALTIEPGLMLAQLRRGLVFLQTGQFEKARKDFLHGLEVMPVENHLPIHINLARCAISLSDSETALKHVLLAQQQGGENRLQWLLVAVDTYIAMEQWANAEAVIQLAIAAGTETTKCLKLMALILAAQNKHAEAEHHIRQALKKTPEDMELLLQLTSLSVVQGHYGESLHCLRSALKIEPENASLWAQIAHLSNRRFRHQAARDAAEQAMTLTEQKEGLERAEALVAMAMVEIDCDQGAVAEQCYQLALEQIPGYIPACLGLGHLFLQWGRIDEAVIQFEGVSSRHPAAGYSALINARKFPDNEETLANIEKIAYIPSLQGPVQSGLLFDLAAIWEHKKNYIKAFHFIHQANDASRQFLSYCPDKHRKHCHSLMQFFNAPFFYKRKNFGSNIKLPVFVLGMPRSGTTLVEQILGGHPDIFGAGELGIIGGVIQRLNSWEQHLGSGKRYPECIYDLSEKQSKILAMQVLEDLQAQSPNSRFIVDKLPHNFENIGLIRLLFPHAPIIHVLRDARDVAISNYFTDYQAKFGGMGFAYDLDDIGKHLLDYKTLMAHWHKTVIHPILTVRYEDVVDDTEGQSKRMLNYIGVAWSPNVLNYQNLERAVKTASIWQVRQPIYQTSKEKWRRYADFLGPLDAQLNHETVLQLDPVAEPLSAPGLFFTAMQQLKDNQFELAEASFRTILVDNPGHATALHMLGVALLQMGKKQQAIVLLEDSIERHPQHQGWYYNLSLAYQALGMSDKSQEIREKAKHIKTLDIQNDW